MNDVESIEREAMRLLRQRKNEDAIALLSEAALEARQSGALLDAASLTATMGIVHFASGANELALHAYRQAVLDDPANYYHRERLAQFLLEELGRPAEALTALEAAAACRPDEPATLQHGYSALRSSILLALGRVEDAVAEFRIATNPAMVSRMYSRGLDLNVAGRFVKHRIALQEVKSYLEIVMSRAERNNDSHTQASAAALLTECEAGGRSSG